MKIIDDLREIVRLLEVIDAAKKRDKVHWWWGLTIEQRLVTISYVVLALFVICCALHFSLTDPRDVINERDQFLTLESGSTLLMSIAYENSSLSIASHTDKELIPQAGIDSGDTIKWFDLNAVEGGGYDHYPYIKADHFRVSALPRVRCPRCRRKLKGGTK